jgi:putative resolvase
LVLDQEHLAPEEEMAQDRMTIVHCFASRLDGLRHYKKKLKEALNADRTPD